MPALLGKVLVALLCVVALVGCSEDDGDSSAGEETISRPSGPLTQRQFLRRGNQICTASIVRLAAFEPPADSTPDRDLKLALRYVRKLLVPALREQVKGLRALRPPRKLQPKTRSLLKRYQRAVEELADDPLLIGQPTELEEVTRRLKDLGLKRCGVPM